MRLGGASLVIDFENSTYDLYGHSGATVSKSFGAAYAVGEVYNYEEIGDYGGAFINMGGSIKGFGIDYCRSPDLYADSVSARSWTFSAPSGNSFYVGWDYYYPVKSGAW